MGPAEPVTGTSGSESRKAALLELLSCFCKPSYMTVLILNHILLLNIISNKTIQAESYNNKETFHANFKFQIHRQFIVGLHAHVENGEFVCGVSSKI